tara:strand:+ start:473 stop:1279 length:807 start_codon:yes stop_codon:yes gene_type:complete
MSETNYVIINSRFRTNNSNSTSDFTFNLGESIEVNEIALKSVSMINAVYNVPAAYNFMQVNNGTVDQQLLIPVGQYTITSLSAAVALELTNIYGGTNTVTLNTLTKKLDFVTTTPLKYKAVALSPLAIVLGFGDSVTSSIINYYPVVASSNVSAPFLPSLEGENNYHIVSTTLGQGQGSLLKNNEKQPIILTIPCNVNFGDVINYEVNEINLNKRRFTRPINIQDIDIRIIDDNGDIVDLGNTQVELVVQIITPSIAPYSIQGNHMMI